MARASTLPLGRADAGRALPAAVGGPSLRAGVLVVFLMVPPRGFGGSAELSYLLWFFSPRRADLSRIARCGSGLVGQGRIFLLNWKFVTLDVPGRHHARAAEKPVCPPAEDPPAV